jgi:DNA-directed RNA polymerase subunit RPC12/RpoP
MTSMSNATVVCPACGSGSIRLSRQKNLTELSRMALGTYPFRCSLCNHRFWANIWRWSVWRYAKCPRCLSLDLTTWVHKVQHLSYWKKLMLTLGATRHRCARCRCNFVSFRPHSPLIGSGATAVPPDEPAPTVD